MKEATVGSRSYFAGHQFHKVTNPCFMGYTRLELSNKNYMLFYYARVKFFTLKIMKVTCYLGIIWK